MIPTFDFSTQRAELDAELADVVAQLPSLRAAHAAAKTAAEDGQYRFQLFQQRLSFAGRYGSDEVAPQLLQLLAEERRRRDAANAAAERARRELANAVYKIDCLRLDLEQLERLSRPVLPVMHQRPEIIKRPQPSLDDDFDFIVMPPSATDAA